MSESVDVYFNLHHRKWSIRSRKTGLVVAHRRVAVFPYGAQLIVQQSGRARVLREGRKNVHAFVRGHMLDCPDVVGEWLAYGRTLPGACRVTYRPHVAGHFVNAETSERIDSVGSAVMVAPRGAPPEVWSTPAKIRLEA